MLLSIIVPTYNCCNYLRVCLEKLDSLDPFKVEIIVINDGSKDETKKILDENYSKKSNYIIHHQENGGLSNARNSGISRATGDYIYFCDSDDEIIVPHFIETLKKLEKDQYDIVVANFINETPQKNLGKTYYSRSKLGLMTGNEFLSLQLKKWNYGSECVQYFLKRSLVGERRFKEGIMHEDDHFFPPLIFRAQQVFVTEKLIYLRKYRTGSLTRTENGVRRNTKDILYIINSFQENEPLNSVTFKTLQIRSWLSLLDYLKKNQDAQDRSKIIGLKPNPFKVLFDSNVLLNFRLKYFRRALRIK